MIPSTSDVAAVAAPGQVGNDGIAKVKEMIEKFEAENLVMHGQLVAEKSAHARAFLYNVQLLRDMKRVTKRKGMFLRLLTLKESKREHSKILRQLKKDAATVTLKAGEQISA